MSKRRLNCLSANDKLLIVKRFEQGVPREQLCSIFNVPRSTLCRILHQKDKIKSQCSAGHGNSVRSRPSKCPELEKCLLEWVSRCKEDEVPVNGPIIKEQALRFAAMLGVTDFKASNGWLEGFRNRFGVGKAQVSNLLKDRDSILKDWEDNGTGSSTKKRMWHGSADVDSFVYEWYRNAVSQNIVVNGPLIQEKALEVAKALGNSDFKASNGWLYKFKSRHGINWKSGEDTTESTAFEEKVDLDSTFGDFSAGAEEFSVGGCRSNEYKEEYSGEPLAEKLCTQPAEDWRSVLKNWCIGYADCDVYNCVETPLLFGALPNQVMFNEGEKTATQRLTILLCANVAGHFEQPMIIGSSTPSHLENLRLRDFGFSWKVNPYAWMSPEIMTEWLNSFNVRMVLQKRNIVLIMEESKCHPQVVLSNIKLVFVPRNGRQPLDLGVVRSFKRHYRTKLIRHLLCNNRPHVSKLDAAMWIVSALKDIEAGELQKCFSEVGISKTKVEPVIQETNTELDNLIRMVSTEMSSENYETIDNHLPTSYSETDLQSIIETIKSCEEDEDTQKESPMSKSESLPPDLKTALENLELVEKFARHNKNTSLYQKLYDIRLEMEKSYTTQCLLQKKIEGHYLVGQFNQMLKEDVFHYDLIEHRNPKSN